MPPELTLTEGFGGCRGWCSAGQDRAGAVPPLTPQPKCSPEGEEAKAGARQAGSIQKGGRGCPQPGWQHLLHRDKNVAIHAQHKEALSGITSGSPFLKPWPGNAIWLCRPSPRTSVHPLKAPNPPKRFPLTPSFGTGREPPPWAPCSSVQLQCSLPGKRFIQQEPGRWSVEDVLFGRLSQPSESLFSRLRVFLNT